VAATRGNGRRGTLAGMRTHRTVFLVPLIAVAVAAGCGGSQGHAVSTASATPVATTRPTVAAAQIRADAFATVATRIYREEAAGPAGMRNAARIAHDPLLIAALRSGKHAAIRAAALRELFLPVKHVVRIRILRGGHTVVDVGGRFVSGSESAPFPAGLGKVQVSMQDILGLTKLVTRFTGARIVVHGRPGDVLASSPALTGVRMPASGIVTVGGRSYAVRTIDRIGFGGEPLRISVLVPA
jgi:hypothetical protein